MSEARSENTLQRAPAAAFDLKKRLEELARGECSADEFVRDSLAGRSRSSDSWDLLSLIDQRYRLGQLPDELFQSIKSRIAWSELQDKEFGTTVELTPAPRKIAAADKAAATPPASPSPAVTAAPAPPAAAPATAPVITAAAGPGSAAAPSAALAVEDIQSVIGAPGSLRAPPLLQPGRVLNGRYVLEGMLGSGGMGTVFKAVDRCGTLPAQADRRVAVKVLRERIEQQPAVLVQLRREFYCTQVLSHPNIVKVYELDRDADLAFYTMELLNGEALHQKIARAQPRGLPRHYAWAVIRAVGSAIAHAHSRNVIHGDLKPQNVMITDRAEVRVLDFGSSRSSLETFANAGDNAARLTATPPYASCDVLEGEQPDPRDDLYALACLSHELLSGRHPFQGMSSLQAREANVRALRPDGLSNAQWRALQGGLSWSRDERSIPVSEWLEQLGIGIEPQRLPDLHAKATPAPARPLPWRDFALPGIAACAALLIALTSRAPAPYVPPARAMMPTHAAVTPPPAVIAASAASLTPPVAAAPTQAKPPVTAAPRASRNAPAPAAQPSITLTAKAVRVRRGVNFAEVRVNRNDDAGGFYWWTEDGTAQAGRDYIPQSRVARSFSKGRRSAALFVRLSADPQRSAAGTFYVQIAPAAAGVRAAPISRTAIVLSAPR